MDARERLAEWRSDVGANVQPGRLTNVEGCAPHVALGFGFPELVDPSMRDRVNQSGDHFDVTVGSVEVAVIGYDSSAREHALIDGGRWQL